jgi:energy-coupling factor transporter ATP-binding protein EcfA2
MTHPVLAVRGLSTSYGRRQVLHDVNLDVHAGEVLALLGRNGAGKSTTLLAIAGFIPEARGEIRLLGQPLTGAPHRRARRLADEGAITFIGGLSANGVAKIMRARNIAAWFPMGSDPSDVRNPLSFITALNSAGAAQGAYLGAIRFHAKSAVYVSMLGNTTYQKTALFGYAQAGVTDVKIVEVPPSTTDFSPYIARIKELHPDVWGGMLYPPEQQTLLVQAAAQQGPTIPFVSSNNVIEDATIAALSHAPFANSLALEKGEDAKRFPTWAEYERELAKYDPDHAVKGPTDGSTTTDWLAVWTFAQIARQLPGLRDQGSQLQHRCSAPDRFHRGGAGRSHAAPGEHLGLRRPCAGRS